MNRYRLRPQYQRRGKTKDGLNRLPLDGIVFEGAKVVETARDLSHWSGYLQEVDDEPAAAAAPKSTPAPAPEPEPEAESSEAATSDESADDGKKVARTLSKTRKRRTSKSEGV